MPTSVIPILSQFFYDHCHFDNDGAGDSPATELQRLTRERRSVLSATRFAETNWACGQEETDFVLLFQFSWDASATSPDP
jgi:hypothetical protein